MSFPQAVTAGGQRSEAGTNLCPQDLAHVKLGIVEILCLPVPAKAPVFREHKGTFLCSDEMFQKDA